MKKYFKLIILMIILLLIIVLVSLNISTENENNVDNINEIQPEEEIKEEYTTLKLYFEDATSGIITYEKRMVEANKLVENPYSFVIDLLIKGPNEKKFKKIIPDNTKINAINLKNDNLEIDVSKEILNSEGTKSFQSIANTLTEFNEVNSVTFLIDGKKNEKISNRFVKEN